VVSNGAEFQISRIGQISLVAHDLDRAIEFYRDVLRLPFLFRVPNLAFFDCGGVRLMLGPPERPELDPPGSTLYYVVDDLTRAYATLRDRGVRLIDEPHLIAKLPDHELWMFFLNGPEGNTVGLMAEVRDGPPNG
jgi:methylmalonyl-CoA/ethylmalonyl-CoA epimerase